MIDSDLAWLYGVRTKRLKEQVRRNLERFPDDFMFKLTAEERKQVVANCDHLKKLKFSYQLPFAFTEQGVAMLSSVLKSKRAILVNIAIMRAFVRLNRILSSHVEVSKKLKELEQKTLKNEGDIQSVVKVIRQLTSKKPSCIGFLK